MLNAKEELLEHAKGREIKCAIITFGNEAFNDNYRTYCLKMYHSLTCVSKFLEEIDKDYNCGYGGQELFGTIWWEDGTWSERGGYDGSEWWEHRKLPDIPDILT